jgi:hypothetical protein
MATSQQRRNLSMLPKALPTITAVSAGVDWISGTLPAGALDYQTWIGDCEYALMELAKGGNILEHRRLQGYEGMGFSNTFVGTKDDRAFAQYTGERANWAYPYMDHPKVHISRIDLQITVQTDVMDLNQGKRCLRAARTYNKALPEHRRRKIDFWLGDAGADTVYIGSASSPIRARIYNKQAQSEDIRYTRCWRYEIVLRNDTADRVYRTVVSEGDQATDYIFSAVIEYCRQRGVEIRGLEHIEPIPLVTVVSVPTDVERKLTWLEKQVKPTLKKLSEQGYGDQAARALGLWLPDAQS